MLTLIIIAATIIQFITVFVPYGVAVVAVVAVVAAVAAAATAVVSSQR